jgi:hypothetical protein
MEIKVKIDGLNELQSSMNDLAINQVPFATMKAINKTAEEIKAELIKEMGRSFDRPTPYTLNSLYIKYAKKNNLLAEVGYKDKSQAGKGNPAANWMHPQVAGGRRHLKRFEVALNRIGVLPNGMMVAPGSACPLDAYGNIPSSLIVQILSYFRAFGEQGYRANITDKRKALLAKGSKRTGTMGYEYFVSKGKGEWYGRQQHLPPGIYKRVGFAQGSAIKPIMMFVEQPSYQRRFPFNETVQKVVDQNINKNFDEAMSEAIKTAK